MSGTPPGVACCGDAGSETGAGTLGADCGTFPDRVQGRNLNRRMRMEDGHSPSQGEYQVKEDLPGQGSLEIHARTG